MKPAKKLFKEKNIHLIFQISLILKGAFAILEILSGIAAYFVTQQFLIKIVHIITRGELVEDPRDFIANHLILWANKFSVDVRLFTTIYLIGHGAIKLWLVIGLLRERLWYYPTAIAFFGLFIIYQLYRYSFTHSLFLLLVTAIDVIVVGLTWHEYKYLRHHKENK